MNFWVLLAVNTKTVRIITYYSKVYETIIYYSLVYYTVLVSINIPTKSHLTQGRLGTLRLSNPYNSGPRLDHLPVGTVHVLGHGWRGSEKPQGFSIIASRKGESFEEPSFTL